MRTIIIDSPRLRTQAIFLTVHDASTVQDDASSASDSRAASRSLAATPSPRLQAWLRGLLAGPLALAAACLVMAGGALWLPEGSAQVNNLVLPVVLFPLIWTALFLYACLDTRLKRGYLVIGALVVANALLLGWHAIG